MIFDRLLQPRPRGALTSADLRREIATAGSHAKSGAVVTPERALYYSAVFACVKVLAESVGQLPFHLYRQRDREKSKAVDHPLNRLLHVAPNGYQTAQEWLEWMIACLALRGNAYCQINWLHGQRVGELLPIHPVSVTPRQHKQTREVVYDIRLDEGGKDTLPSREVLHIKLFALDGLTGANPIRYAREAIGLGIATEEHGARLFSNGARPGGVLETPNKLTDAAYNRMRSSWEERHHGSENAHRVAILEEGTKWQSIGMSSDDAQFLETRKYQRSEVAGLYRVPPHLIGDLEHATFSNIEQQSLDFVVHGLMPYLTRIERRILMQLLSPAEQREYVAKFNVRGLLRGDMAARGSFYNLLVQNGALSPNEIRELEDMNPREGGDVWLTPLNMAVNGQPPPKDTAK